jgi:uncharacterized protein YjbI with pentapeptide repeats
MTQEELNAILAEHKLWLAGKGGKRAILTGADLTGCVLTRADLSGAVLIGCDLTGAIFAPGWEIVREGETR